MSNYLSQFNLTTGTFDVVSLKGASPNMPVLTDDSNNLVSGQIDLKTQVSAVLPTTFGGTGTNIILTDNKFIVSAAGGIAEGTSATSPTFTGVTVSGAAASLPVKTNALKGLTTGLIDLASEATGANLTAYYGNTPGNLPPISNVLSLDPGNVVRKTPASDTSSNMTMVQRDRYGGINGERIQGTNFFATDMSNQIVLGGGLYNITLNAPFPAASRVLTLPDPGANASVVCTEGAQTINGNKTLAGTTNLSALTASLPLQLNGSKNVVSALINLTSGVSGVLPVANGGSTGTNTGDVTLAGVGAVPNANGASLAGQVLTLQPASSTQPGVVTAGAQTLGGAKTFAGAISAANLAGTNSGDLTLAAVGSSPNANGASLAGQVLTLQPASATQPGVVTAGTQTFAGVKSFADPISGPFIGLTGGSNQIGIGNGNVIFINAPAPSANRTITIQDPGAAAVFITSEGNQTINGNKTFSAGAFMNCHMARYYAGAVAQVVPAGGTVALVFDTNTYFLPQNIAANGANDTFTVTYGGMYHVSMQLQWSAPQSAASDSQIFFAISTTATPMWIQQAGYGHGLSTSGQVYLTAGATIRFMAYSGAGATVGATVRKQMSISLISRL